MLFGRRKPGFTVEKKDPKIGKEINADKRDELIKQELEKKKEIEEKKDFLDFLDEVDETTELSAEDEEMLERIEETKEEEVEESEEILLANFIRHRSLGAHLTSKKQLLEEDENIEEILDRLYEDETCKDIIKLEGEKDIYFYSNENMSDNYANIALLVEEKDLPKTISEMVRWNGETYPCATPLYYFKNSPYLYTDAQIERALDVIKEKEEYSDIKELTTGNYFRYLYSTRSMTEKYARALAEGVEYGEYGYTRYGKRRG